MAHPRLFIWGLLEARLQHADLLVLGGLNEGTWPPRGAVRSVAVAPDARKASACRRPSAASASPRTISRKPLGAREVFLTRAARGEGTPTVPSRWLLRLDAVLHEGALDRRI